MADGFIHTVHKNGEWLNEIEDGNELPGSFATKEAAVAQGGLKATNAKTEHVIHLDGTIGERTPTETTPQADPAEAWPRNLR